MYILSYKTKKQIIKNIDIIFITIYNLFFDTIFQVTSSSSEASARSGHHGRVDSIDSGNDGDESGLESSLSSNKRGVDIRRIKSEVCDCVIY